MMEYWARFATNGNPNGTGASNWPQFGATDEELLQLDEAITSFSNYHKSQCNYVADLPLP
jgi:carboxylesterase type B